MIMALLPLIPLLLVSKRHIQASYQLAGTSSSCGSALEEALRISENKISFRQLANEVTHLQSIPAALSSCLIIFSNSKWNLCLVPRWPAIPHIYTQSNSLLAISNSSCQVCSEELFRLTKERFTTPNLADSDREELPLLDSEWVEVKALDTLLDIVHRLNQIMFVGPPLCERWSVYATILDLISPLNKAMTRNGSRLPRAGCRLVHPRSPHLGLPFVFRRCVLCSERISTSHSLRLHRPFKSFLDLFPSSIRTCEEMLRPLVEIERAALPTADERPVRN
jgi:hypothetical protein